MGRVEINCVQCGEDKPMGCYKDSLSTCQVCVLALRIKRTRLENRREARKQAKIEHKNEMRLLNARVAKIETMIREIHQSVGISRNKK